MELLRKVIRRGEIIACHSIIKQGTDRACSVMGHLAKSLESIACFRAFSRITGMNSQRREIELIKIVAGLFLYRGSELFFLLGKMVEFDSTHRIFTNPRDKRTEDYITGRFG